MKNTQKGFVIPLIIAIVALMAVGGGVYIYNSTQTIDPDYFDRFSDIDAGDVADDEGGDNDVTDDELINTDPGADDQIIIEGNMPIQNEPSVKDNNLQKINCGSDNNCFAGAILECNPASVRVQTEKETGLAGLDDTTASLDFSYKLYSEANECYLEITVNHVSLNPGSKALDTSNKNNTYTNWKVPLLCTHL